MCESLVRKYSQKFDLNYSILRFGSVYGPGKSSNAVRNFITNTIQNKENVIWGSGIRANQFTNVDDLSIACRLVLDKKAWNETFNLVSPEITTTKQLSELIESKFGGQFSFDLDKPEGQSFVYMQSEKAQKILGWKPRTLSNCIEEVLTELKELEL